MIKKNVKELKESFLREEEIKSNLQNQTYFILNSINGGLLDQNMQVSDGLIETKQTSLTETLSELIEAHENERRHEFKINFFELLKVSC